MSKVGFKMIHGHNYATWELKIVKFSNFRQNHFSDFETPFSVGLPSLAVKYYIATYLWVNGAIRKVPKPEPQTAMPVAKARFFSKYIDTHTIAGKYMRPNPIPERNIIVAKN